MCRRIDLMKVLDAISSSRQPREKLQCLYENLIAHKYMENLKQASEEILSTVTAPEFASRILYWVALAYNSYFFRKAVLEKLFDIKFLCKHFNFSRGCGLLVKMASKTVTKSIARGLLGEDRHKNGYVAA